MRVLVLDSENYDPTLKRYGSGAVFKYHFPEVEFEPLIWGCITQDKEEIVCDSRTVKGRAELMNLLNSHDALVFHNGLYDLAVLRYMYREEFDVNKWFIYDTMLMAKLHTQQLLSYSLDSLADKYTEQKKQSDILLDYAWMSGLYQKWVSEQPTKTGKPRHCHTRPTDKVLKDWSMGDLRRFPDKVLAEYCMQDVRATEELFRFLCPKLAYLDLTEHSDIVKVCLDAKFHGFRIDLAKTNKLKIAWNKIVHEKKINLLRLLNADSTVNLNSPDQLAPLLSAKGYKVPLTDKGNFSINKYWLPKQKGEIIEQLIEYRKAKYAVDEYVNKLLSYQDIIPAKYITENKGYLFPSLKPEGATATGRFTSGGGNKSLELNVLAVSGRDEIYGVPIRELFLPHEGEKLIVCDFSNQEPRLQVHYAYLLKCKNVEEVIKNWNENPKLKFHNMVAEKTGLDYSVAKMVVLGLSFAMTSVGLSTRLNIPKTEAEEMIALYFRMFPFIQELQLKTSWSLKKLGYIKILSGRKLYLDRFIKNGKEQTGERLALSKLSQGSGADQTKKAMIDAWKAGLKVLLSVHDEIIVSSRIPERDLEVLRDCMENAYKLVVPVVAEGGIGDNWLEAK